MGLLRRPTHWEGRPSGRPYLIWRAILLDANLDDTSCLILDVHMKGLSGVELQELLIARGRRTPIIFVTAFPDERTRTHALGAGATGFLSKPFSDEKLTKCLDLALANRIP